MARVLVTGGAGFIGSHLVDALLTAEHEVLVLDNHSTGNPLNLMQAHRRGARTVVGSVAWPLDIRHAMGFRPELVFHLAAQIDVRASVEDPRRDAGTNIVGTINMLEASRAAGVRRFVFVSSAAVFGDGGSLHHASHPAPISPYGASKAAAELYVDLYEQATYAADGLTGMSACTVVLSNVYGPRQRPGFGAVNLFARALLTGGPVTLYGDGGNVRDYLYVADAVTALMTVGGVGKVASGRGLPVGRVLVGTGVGTTDRKLLAKVASHVVIQTGTSMQHGREPARVEPARSCDIRSMVLPTWGNGLHALDDGLRLTVEAIRKELGL